MIVVPNGCSGGWSVELTYQKGSVDGVIGVVQRRNPIVGTEVVGNITPTPETKHLSSSSSSSSSSTKSSTVEEREKKDGKMETGGRLTALCTLDGESLKQTFLEVKTY